MTQHWFEDQKFSVEVFDERGYLLEVLARLHDLDAARRLHGMSSEMPNELVVPVTRRPDPAAERPG
jgi:hypothetical protein